MRVSVTVNVACSYVLPGGLVWGTGLQQVLGLWPAEDSTGVGQDGQGSGHAHPEVLGELCSSPFCFPSRFQG